MDLLRLTPSELQHRGRSLEGTSGIHGGPEVSGTKTAAGGQHFSQIERWAEAIVPFLSPSSTEPQSWQVGAISEAN